MEVVGGQPSQLGAKGLDAPRPHRDDIVAVLERAFDVEEGLLHQDEPIAVEKGRGHDHVHEPRLVLEIQEDEVIDGSGEGEGGPGIPS